MLAAFSLKPSRLNAAYERVRPRLAKDPLFMRKARAFGVSLAEFDARIARAPKTTASLLEWLDGPDQYRYAGLQVLFDAYGRSAPAKTVRSDLNVAPGRLVFHAGDLTVGGNLTLGAGAAVFVLGQLKVDGWLSAPNDFSVVAAHDASFNSGVSFGELIALGTLTGGPTLYLGGNDYSCRAKHFVGDVLIDFERLNVFLKVKVTQRPKTRSASAQVLGVSAKVDLGDALLARLSQGDAAPPADVAPVDEETLWASARESPKTLRTLLSKHRWSANQLRIALDYAARWGQPKSIRLLLGAGATDPSGNAFVAAAGSAPAMEALLDATGGSANQRVNGQPLIHVVANVGDEKVMALLLARGADVNAVDAGGVTALHVCAYHGKVKLARVLLERGASTVAQTMSAWHDFAPAGATPLAVAERQLKFQSAAKPWQQLVKLLGATQRSPNG